MDRSTYEHAALGEEADKHLDADRREEIRREAKQLLRNRPSISRAGLIEETYFWCDGRESEQRLFERIAGEVWDEAQPEELAREECAS